MPPDHPRYRLRRIWLSEEEEREYYDGAANSALWPLCHRAHVQPVFRAGDFETYRTVNARFATAAVQEASDPNAAILVQDYHFALAPEMIRAVRPSSAIATFWHIPWPQWQTFATCPWRYELLRGLLGSNLIGFQTAADCLNFVESAERILGAHIDLANGAVSYAGRRVVIRDYPASIAWPGLWHEEPAADACRARMRRELRLADDARLGVGVDRLDFTKGIEEKFLAIERLFEMQPELVGQFTFLQLAEPSRGRLAAYRATRARLLQTYDRINRRFSTSSYQPLVLVEGHHTRAVVGRSFRAADLCFVNSLHDGMNLVAKEFVAAREDEAGVLVLSEFAGAANELWDALLVNPYDIDATARALVTALAMPREQQRERMRRMRETVASHDARHWAELLLNDLVEQRLPRETAPLLSEHAMIA